MVPQKSDTKVLASGIEEVLDAVSDFYEDCQNDHDEHIPVQGEGMPPPLLKKLCIDFEDTSKFWTPWQPATVRGSADDLPTILSLIPTPEKEATTAAALYWQSHDTDEAVHQWIYEAILGDVTPIFWSLR